MKKQINVLADILDENELTAQKINASLTAQKTLALNIMGSPGCGKTTFLEKTIAALKADYRFAVIEGDLYTDKDARRILAHGVPAVQINTAGGCHLNAAMVETVLPELDLANLDILIVENVGNLVCPAEFNVGEHAKIVVLSVTEGEDKPQKYPLAFRAAEVAIINKIDLLPYTDFDLEAATRDILALNPAIKLINLSCKSGAGFDIWLAWLQERLRSFTSQ
ncbi:MAG: hydrogenase nickel incorporation protein HypB [Sporomusaceae bacterium]|jgi:hydrogenase nickel incorporation protein HypB|nr:hydrogenase nickel incorporation protein HypB [Sporomusaceae bacterium]